MPETTLSESCAGLEDAWDEAEREVARADDLEGDNIRSEATGLAPLSLPVHNSSNDSAVTVPQAAGPGASRSTLCPVEAISCDLHVM